jgi:hypothetical protein
MTRTQYYTATTLDGFIADEHNSLDWLFEVERGPDPGSEFEEFFAGIGAMAMGSTTYEWVFDHENLADDPEPWTKWYADTAVLGLHPPRAPGDPACADPLRPGQRRAGPRRDGARSARKERLAGRRGRPRRPVRRPRRLTSSQLELVEVARQGQFARLSYRVRT